MATTNDSGSRETVDGTLYYYLPADATDASPATDDSENGTTEGENV